MVTSLENEEVLGYIAQRGFTDSGRVRAWGCVVREDEDAPGVIVRRLMIPDAWDEAGRVVHEIGPCSGRGVDETACPEKFVKSSSRPPASTRT
jgi:hypothetical protein